MKVEDKEIKNLAVIANESLQIILDMLAERKVPNIMRNEYAVQLNIHFGEQLSGLVMNVSVYEHQDDRYLLDLVTFFPQDDKFYPDDATDKNKKFKITGAPYLGAYHLQTPLLGIISLDDGMYHAFVCIINRIEDILKETLGCNGL